MRRKNNSVHRFVSFSLSIILENSTLSGKGTPLKGRGSVAPKAVLGYSIINQFILGIINYKPRWWRSGLSACGGQAEGWVFEKLRITQHVTVLYYNKIEIESKCLCSQMLLTSKSSL